MSNISQVRRIVRINTPVDECEYTQDILNSWTLKLKCFKTNNLFNAYNITPSKINAYLGTIQSALNYSTNPCYFKISLNKIKTLIDIITEC